MEKPRAIKIIQVEELHRPASSGGCGSGHAGSSARPASAQQFAAGIDTDIFEADDLSLEGERLWESFWKTRHTYGAVHEGQTLAEIFSALDMQSLDKIQHDVSRLCSAPEQMSDAERDDVLGMVLFLLSLEQGQPDYNALEAEGYAAAMARFSQAVAKAVERR